MDACGMAGARAHEDTIVRAAAGTGYAEPSALPSKRSKRRGDGGREGEGTCKSGSDKCSVRCLQPLSQKSLTWAWASRESCCSEEKGRRDTDRTDRPRQTDKTERQTTDRRQATDKQTRNKQTENRQPGDQTDRGTEVRQVASFEPTSHASSESTDKIQKQTSKSCRKAQADSPTDGQSKGTDGQTDRPTDRPIYARS